MHDLARRLLRYLGAFYDEAQLVAGLNALSERLDVIETDMDKGLSDLTARIAEFDVDGKTKST
jgi:hypothetical protein